MPGTNAITGHIAHYRAIRFLADDRVGTPQALLIDFRTRRFSRASIVPPDLTRLH